MLHIILMILKIIGILLLVLLGIVLLFLLSLLFVPVCYSGWGKKEGKTYQGKASVSWLFHLIHGTVVYEEKQSRFELYLCGIPLMKLREKTKNRKHTLSEKPTRTEERNVQPVILAKKEETTVQAESPVKQAEGNIQAESPVKQAEDNRKPERPAEKPENKVHSPKPQVWGKIKKSLQKMIHFPSAVWKRLKKIRLTFRGFCDKIKEWYTFLTSDTMKAAFQFIKITGKKLLRHILPRKIRGRLVFGFEDPSWTGQVLGAAAILYPVYQDRLQLIPVFDQAILEGEVRFSGRIFWGYLLWTAWQVYKNRDIRKIYHRFQNKEA